MWPSIPWDSRSAGEGDISQDRCKLGPGEMVHDAVVNCRDLEGGKSAGRSRCLIIACLRDWPPPNARRLSNMAQG